MTEAFYLSEQITYVCSNELISNELPSHKPKRKRKRKIQDETLKHLYAEYTGGLDLDVFKVGKKYKLVKQTRNHYALQIKGGRRYVDKMTINAHFRIIKLN